MKHKHYECIVAWAEGKQIQVQYRDGSWHDLAKGSPTWHEEAYRIKPNLKKLRVALFEDNGATWTTHCTNDGGAKSVEKTFFFSRWLTDWIEYEI